MPFMDALIHIAKILNATMWPKESKTIREATNAVDVNPIASKPRTQRKLLGY